MKTYAMTCSFLQAKYTVFPQHFSIKVPQSETADTIKMNWFWLTLAA